MKGFRLLIFSAAVAACCLAGCGFYNNRTVIGETISTVSREDGSGTRSAFVELFGIEEKREDGSKIDHTTKEAIIANGTGIVLTNITGDPRAIGYVSLGSLNNNVKAIKINGVPLSGENIKNGSYEISRPFIIATSETTSEAAQDFVHFILSDQGQSIVEKSGYVPSVNAPGHFESTGREGKIVISGSSSVTPVMEKLVEAYRALNLNVVIELQQNDSTTGLHDTMDGTADIGMASRDLKESENSLKPTIIAMDGIAIVINKRNTIESLTTDEVKAIFTGERTLW